MSVINSVLKELDQKPSAFTPLELDTVTALDSREKNTRWYWLLLPVIVILLAIVFWGRYYDIAKQDQVAKPVEATSNIQQPPKEIEQSDPQIDDSRIVIQQVDTGKIPEPNQISGLQIRENEEFMELEFQLTKFTPSFLKQRSNNRYVFVIKKVANSIVTPQISGNPWLKQIQISTSGEDVEILFDTQQGVLVDTQDSRGDSAFYWLIRLKKSLEVLTAPGEKESNSSATPNTVMNAPPIISSSHSKQTNQAMQEEEVSVAPVKLQIRPVQNKPTAKVKLNAAIQAAKSGDIDVAKKQLKKLIGGEFDRQARIQLLGLLSKQSDGQGFPGLLSDSLQKYPQDRVFLLYEANRLFAQKQYLTLIEKFKTHTQNAELLSLLATSYQRTNQHELAADHFISALKINPQQPRLWISLAISQQNLLQREPALNSYQMALRSGPMNQRLHDFVQAKIKQLSN